MRNRSTPPRSTKVLRVTFISIWVAAILICLSSYLSDPGAFSAENIAKFLQRFEGEIWLVYFALSVLRGFTLLPSTPLVLAGTLLFPGQPIAVLAMSMIGILISSSMIYFFSDLLGFTEYFESHNPKLTHKIKDRLERPTGFAFVTIWAFFPFVPTDLICYVAGTTKMNFAKFIAAIFLGELVLCTIYIYFGKYLIDLWK